MATNWQPPPKPVTGALSWGLGFGVLVVCLPFVGSLITGALMGIVGNVQSKQGGLAAENGRNAANWGLTYVTLTVVLVGTHFGLLALLTADGGEIEGFFPFGLIICTWAAVTVAHLVFTIMGMTRAGRQQVFKAPAIPFLRAR
ncbi:DUF4870 domain-containing protein [Nocardioides sp. BGMRC 2183]|nr:DUF4870 domain-containing protein [Nocardioides sp. BGMRC 2183]